MFLSVLNSTEKEEFLNLVINVANVDGEFSDIEKAQVNAYALEMGLILKDNDNYTKSTDSLIDILSKSKNTTKKAIFMEIVALMLVDGMNDKEKSLLDSIQKAFEFDDKFRNDTIEWYSEILPLYKKGFELAGIGA